MYKEASLRHFDEGRLFVHQSHKKSKRKLQHPLLFPPFLFLPEKKGLTFLLLSAKMNPISKGNDGNKDRRSPLREPVFGANRCVAPCA